MQSIRATDTKMETQFRSELYRRGLRYRTNYAQLVGKPDIVFVSRKVVIFLDSCFWHQCPLHANMPKVNRRYWIPKFTRNKRRDLEVNAELRKEGWYVIRFWEHQLKNNLDKCIQRVESTLARRAH